ncbi:TetR/AcrR family transcriptional regulator [Wenyingzhuangia sp. chi5]|uniref:TetR/AcrR family transcriptional regulator n=1 Tax=Wenyingzhuangia gilva TaxID=3057677 RepID=A0ABT8VUS3_9FLAO|nr:TetR/AcrR family transcriptional regulator [Wenyingzhuangia sp. chi5]MDO3695713.1 TetR/AcrR family transcriptional regulator [Wenyingzhuangia sp. chi5]
MEQLSKSEIKRNALIKATICLVINNGFHAAPMSKIAKMANVSPGTIYLYFENKQDLINKVYLEIKASFAKHAFKNYDPSMEVREGFENIWKQIADFKLVQVEEALFLSQCDNTPMIDEESKKEGIKHLQPLIDLWKRGQEEGIIKECCHYVLYAYTVYPLAFLMNAKQNKEININKKYIQDAYLLAWDSIKQSK